jgi:hypothetical protein
LSSGPMVDLQFWCWELSSELESSIIKGHELDKCLVRVGGAEYDQDCYAAVMTSTKYLEDLVAQAQGRGRYLDDMPMYSDYAAHDTPGFKFQ